ncbi:hypothetical protein ACFPOB_26115 [Bosea eneae]|uniref:Sce7726 family protein n=1 Tax=Bosea eneae TaxID=151454 RepID=A0ABW0IYF9_9HYPH
MKQLKAASGSYRSKRELRMREIVDAWLRERTIGARIVHELVIGRGESRIDMAAIEPFRIVAVEIKSHYDVTDRMLAQISFATLACGEAWIVTEAGDDHQKRAVELLLYLLPSVGWAEIARDDGLSVRNEATARAPHPWLESALCWVAELTSAAVRARLYQPGKKPPTHSFLTSLWQQQDAGERTAAICAQLRARDAFWRSDPVIPLAGDAAAPVQVKAPEPLL